MKPEGGTQSRTRLPFSRRQTIRMYLVMLV